MRGIITFFKKSRISKIFIGVILPLPLLLLSFILGAVEVKADSAFPATVVNGLTQVTVSNEATGCTYYNLKDLGGISGNSTDNGNGYSNALNEYVAGAHGYYEGVVSFSTSTIEEQYSFSYASSYLGYYFFTLNFNWSIPVALSDGTYSNLILESFESSGNDIVTYVWSAGNSSSNTSRSCSVTFFCYLDPEKDYRFIDRNSFNLKFRVYLYLSGTAQNNPWNNCKIDLTTIPSTSSSANVNITSYVRVCDRDKYYLYNINENLKGISSPIVSAINSASATAHSDSAAEKNAINAAASQAHTDSTAEKNAINAAASQAHNDAVTAHNDATNLDNHLMNDSSNFSSNQDTLKNDIDVKQAAADNAVDGAVHNYNSELDTVEDFQWRSFFTSQSGAAVFWRDVGEYILDANNLGFIAVGLGLVTIITLFVFLLRL